MPSADTPQPYPQSPSTPETVHPPYSPQSESDVPSEYHGADRQTVSEGATPPDTERPQDQIRVVASRSLSAHAFAAQHRATSEVSPTEPDPDDQLLLDDEVLKPPASKGQTEAADQPGPSREEPPVSLLLPSPASSPTCTPVSTSLPDTTRRDASGDTVSTALPPEHRKQPDRPEQAEEVVLVEDQKRQTEEAPRRPEHTEKQGQESGEEEAVATPPETTSQAIQLPQQTGLVMDDARGWKFEEVEGGEECCEDAFSKLVAGDYSPEEGVELAESFLTNNALPYDASLNIENLEEGSRNNVFRVWDNGEVDFVFRIPKPTVDPTDQERGAGLVRESGVLNRLPPTIAAPYFKLDDSCALLPFPYVVESYIPGHDGSEAVWNESSLTALGKKLGYAHKSGSSSQATVLGENVQRMDLCYEFNTRVNGGLSRLRDESAIAVAESLVRAISKYLKKGQQLFDSIDTFSLLHNDLAPSNIQVTDGDVFIRDWEFTAFGDGAHDLSLFYDASARLVDGKMRVFLNEYQEDTLLDAYQSVFGHDPTLKQRVRIWQQLEKAATVLYMMEELDNPGTTRLQRFPRELLRRECDLVLSTIDFRIPMVY